VVCSFGRVTFLASLAFGLLILICYLHLSTVYFSFYRVFIVLRADVRALVSLAVLLGFNCLVAFVYFVYFYEQINDDDELTPVSMRKLGYLSATR